MQQLKVNSVRKVMEADCGLQSTDRLLIALSGGADSMALIHLLNQMPWHLEAAHCNFGLRSDESDKDEEFVRLFCSTNNIKLHVIQFDTEQVADEKGISIEMAARDLRYNWFEQLQEQNDLTCVVTGHHGDDSIETFFLNLMRGTGVKGLSGIKHRNGNRIRPLLQWSRKDIEAYCQWKQVGFRTDSSNADTRFIRNKIRHEIIPLFESVNPSFFQTMLHNMEHLKDADGLLAQTVEQARHEMVVEEHDRLLIPISRLMEYPHRNSILFELLRPYGFNSATVNDVISHLNNISGKQFFSDTHRLIKDRYNLLVTENPYVEVDHFWVEEGETHHPLQLCIQTYDRSKNFLFSRDPHIIHLDFDQVEMPLLVRKWQQGDTFQPLGMSGFKKMSDFFIDSKFSIADKEAAWLMLSGEDIVWVVGHRIDDRYKVTNRTKRILEIQLK